MAANTSPIFELTPNCHGQQFTSADTTAKKNLITGGANGTRVDAIFCSTNDTAAVNLAFYVNDGTTDFYIGNVNVPIGSGYTTVIRVEAMRVLSPDLGFLILPTNYILKCSCVATMTASKTTDVFVEAGDY